MTLWQLLVTFLVGALLMYGYTRMRSGQNAEIKALKAKLEAGANCLVGEARFRGALSDRAARGALAVPVVDETLLG